MSTAAQKRAKRAAYRAEHPLPPPLGDWNERRDQARAEERLNASSYDADLERVDCPACSWFLENERGIERRGIIELLARHYRKVHGVLGQGGDRRKR